MSSGYSLRKRIRCTCPCCEKKHILTLYWSGKGVPRKLCKRCRTLSSELGDIIHHTVSYEKTVVETSQLDYFEIDSQNTKAESKA
jgi:hypothetical protein